MAEHKPPPIEPPANAAIMIAPQNEYVKSIKTEDGHDGSVDVTVTMMDGSTVYVNHDLSPDQPTEEVFR